MLYGVITWTALLLSIGQTSVKTYTYVRDFASYKGYHAVVRGLGNTALYDPSGRLVKSLNSVADIAVGERFFWYLLLNKADELCSVRLDGAGATRCMKLPKHPGEYSGIKYLRGGIYLFIDSFTRDGDRGKGRYLFNLIRLDEKTSLFHVVSTGHSFSHVPTWCFGDALEYMYVDDAVVRLDGVRKARLPGEDRMGTVPPDGCAVNRNVVAVGSGGHLIVNGSDTSIESSGIVFPFKDGWLLESSAGFQIYSRMADRQLASGLMGGDFVMYYDGDRFYFLNHAREP
jgi:hypothetical protein